MNPKIVQEPAWFVVGMGFYGDPFSQASGWSEDNEIGLLWQRFFAFFEAHDDAIKHLADPEAMLEIHVETSESEEKGLFEVFVGTRVSKLEDVPLECTVKVLPSTQYAVFTLEGEEIVSDWGRTMRDWMATSGHQQAHRYGIQYYDRRFKGLDRVKESQLDVYVPVLKAEQ
jgi:AraC family transcriptional regulator